MSILTRYFLRESGVATLGVGATVLLIMLANLLAKALGMTAEGALPAHLIPAIMAFNAVNLLMYVLPVGLFIGLMLALGRLNRDSELSVMRACGYGPSHLTRAVLWLAIPVTLLAAFITLVGWPYLDQVRTQMIDTARSQKLLEQLPVGRFIEDPSGKLVLYVGGKAKGGYTDIFAFNQPLNSGSANRKSGIEMAPTGHLIADDDGNRYMVLADGRRIQGDPGQADWTVVDYRTHEILIPGASSAITGQSTQKSSWALLFSKVPDDQAQIFYRISQALSALVLALIAVPLAQSRPRSGRYGRLFWAFLLYALYFNLIALIDNAIKHQELSLLAGMAVTHGSFILLWLGLLWWSGNGVRRLRQRWLRWRHGYA
ncbi:LPS export ABC transporter permease LptF [Halothiobacillus diazotrophicus]|uniref:Lipopolysaccharide export system permease protein LptF n=1 Tax=Halothiobacillus diazotrophicus TaxID=1860122 RepID=A0A191ZEA4_9GAMM|nr:LPS export ABC transporter permease LptF [Halothiobacillus diazotrophicus]ANJ66199.1 LPS export ABC transporter permease LptF [Halothiobacillus diazotrophicus]